MKKRLIIVLAIVAAVAGAAIAVPAFAATKTVKVGPKTSFGPKSLSIKSGDTVRFRWTGSLPHDVVITKGPGIRRKKTISRVRTRGIVSKKFNTKGTYSILCQVHAPTMKMTIKVT
jgi:plastocyanin